MELLEAILSALGLKFKVVIAGAVGAFVSLRFFDGLGTAERWTTFVGGWALAAYLGNPVTLYLELPAAMELGIALAIGLFGMSIAAALIRVIRDTEWLAIFKRKTGG
jgi:hypothetical protein